jgi:hypothetical protein
MQCCCLKSPSGRVFCRFAEMVGELAMKRVILAAVLAGATSFTAASAADRNCYSAADIEAEQAILFQTDLMVISSACQDTVYGEFRSRNKDAIIRYQNAMIDHFRRTGARNPKSAFDTWQTSLANAASRKHAVVPTAQVCQQAAEILKLASTLDPKGFREYAISHAVNDTHPKCK